MSVQSKHVAIPRKSMANFRIGMTERWGAGDDQQRTEWIRVAVWGKRAEIGKHIHKGSFVFVRGSLRTSKYSDKEGVTRYVTEVRADDIGFLQPKEAALGVGDEAA
jgi:single-strand DNA-binding protein